MVTVCMHTPRTLQIVPSLTFPILVIDSIVTLIFTGEAIIKAHHFGLFKVSISFLILFQQKEASVVAISREKF